MSTMRFHNDTRNALADAFASRCDDGSIQVRTSTRPASINDPAAGTLLAILSLPDPCFGTAVEGTVTANTIPGTQGLETGDIGHFRVLDSVGNVVEDSESIGVSGQVELVINNLTVTESENVEIVGWTWTMPAE